MTALEMGDCTDDALFTILIARIWLNPRTACERERNSAEGERARSCQLGVVRQARRSNSTAGTASTRSSAACSD